MLNTITFTLPAAVAEAVQAKAEEWQAEGVSLATWCLAGLHLLLTTCSGKADWELIVGDAQRQYPYNGLPAEPGMKRKSHS